MTFDWDEEKNSKLKAERNISFEEIILCINENRIVDVIKNPNSENYPNQHMYLVNYDNYIYVVPFIENKEKEEIFLKTIFPSRFYTKKYLSRGNKNEEI